MEKEWKKKVKKMREKVSFPINNRLNLKVKIELEDKNDRITLDSAVS